MVKNTIVITACVGMTDRRAVFAVRRPDLIVFDCDGTLVDSQANIIRAVSETFDRAQLPVPDPHAIRRIVGLSLVQAMQALLPDGHPDLHARLAADYKTAFQRLRGHGLVEEPLYPQARVVIETLSEMGIALGVATGKSDRGLALCLAHHNLTHHFITLQTADRHPSKPHPSMLEQAMADADALPAHTWMVGDTVFDMALAANAGATALGVDWGYHDADELRAAGAVDVLTGFPALLQALERAA
jgi:phosphoglycolate phosphatase